MFVNHAKVSGMRPFRAVPCEVRGNGPVIDTSRAHRRHWEDKGSIDSARDITVLTRRFGVGI